MRFVCLILFLNLLCLRSLSQENHCDVFEVTEVMTGEEAKYNFADKERVLYLTLTNVFQEFNINGSTMTTLTVLDQDRDTIGHEVIKGVPPEFQKSQTYAVFIRKNYTKEINVKKISVMMDSYCDNLAIKTNRITKIKRESPRDQSRDGQLIVLLIQLTFDILSVIAQSH